ncbi:holo-ACP synthase [Thermoactinomyces sp. DSM 45892]|uniref:holo-ACP synthase n=1 Tax=Thermoactinomyces sp. DSM 45892 TaxID=1882753 RepID=UPI00089D5775|nr:holo-ACP synthase [Thermoactinomyces sp. DSM 45892]SDZ30618.1 holo-[acyl-carrier-protein] synthase [Thermoactinomyces sp. DSM 45892]
MVFGIGTDIVEIERIALINLERFAKRILNEEEQTHLSSVSKRTTEYIAGRFAAKEAISKALGTGIGSQLSFHDISIVKDKLGAPKVQLAEPVMKSFFGDQNVRIHLSISHSQRYAVATAVIEVD